MLSFSHYLWKYPEKWSLKKEGFLKHSIRFILFSIPTQITQQKRERNLYTVEMWLFFKKHRFFPKTNLVTLLNFFVYSDYWEKIGFSCWLCQKFQWYQIIYSFFTFEWKSGIGFFIVAAMNFLVAFLNALVDK